MSYELRTIIPITAGVLTIEGLGWNGELVKFVTSISSREPGDIIITGEQDDVFLFGDDLPYDVVPGEKRFGLQIVAKVIPSDEGVPYTITKEDKNSQKNS